MRKWPVTSGAAWPAIELSEAARKSMGGRGDVACARGVKLVDDEAVTLSRKSRRNGSYPGLKKAVGNAQSRNRRANFSIAARSSITRVAAITGINGDEEMAR